jgi:two-component system cell cycle response regulator DivK
MKVLVVDDDYDNRSIAAAALKAAGYEVDQAAEGIEALAKAGAAAPDVILMDLTMPGLSGWDLAARLKALDGLKGVPIIAFTAHALAGSEERAREAGCDAYLSKPCTARDIVNAVKSAGGNTPCPP